MDRPTFLMTDPACFDVSYRINPWMDPRGWTAAHARAACEGSAALRTALVAAGARVETIEAVRGLPDLVFPANAAVVLDGKVLLARFRHPERQGEEPVFRSVFQRLRTRGLVDRIVGCRRACSTKAPAMRSGTPSGGCSGAATAPGPATAPSA